MTGERDHDSLVFDAATGALLHLLRDPSAERSRTRSSARTRAGSSRPGPTTAGLWSAATGKFVEAPERARNRLLTAAAFTPDSRGIVTSERNGDVRRAVCVICGGVDELLPLARERLEATKRVLTDAERRLYVG